MRILISILMFVFLGLHPLSIKAQYWPSLYKGYALTGSFHYNRILNNGHTTSSLGGIGISIGIGREFYSNNGFITHIGAEVSFYNSRIGLADSLHLVSMTDTEGDPFEGNFIFNDIVDKYKVCNVYFPIRVGINRGNKYYFLMGVKTGFNLYGKTVTSTEITSTAQYEMFIGDDNNGMFSNMPNHGLKTVERAVEQKVKFNPFFIGSVEVGYIFIPKGKPPRMHHRFALFCDYSFTSISNFERPENYNLIINTSNTSEYTPTFNSFIFNNINSSNLNSLFIGIKITSILRVRKNIECKKVEKISKGQPRQTKQKNHRKKRF